MGPLVTPRALLAEPQAGGRLLRVLDATWFLPNSPYSGPGEPAHALYRQAHLPSVRPRPCEAAAQLRREFLLYVRMGECTGRLHQSTNGATIR